MTTTDGSACAVEVRNGCGGRPTAASTALIGPSGRKAMPQITAETLCGITTGSTTSVRHSRAPAMRRLSSSANASASAICSGLTITE